MNIFLTPSNQRYAYILGNVAPGQTSSISRPQVECQTAKFAQKMYSFVPQRRSEGLDQA